MTFESAPEQYIVFSTEVFFTKDFQHGALSSSVIGQYYTMNCFQYIYLQLIG